MTKSSKTKIYNKDNIKDVWDIVPKTSRKKNGHPAVMELEVVETIYNLYEDIYKEKDNVLVFDPFTGIGTTFIPIKDKYNYIGFELNNTYIDIAKSRL